MTLHISQLYKPPRPTTGIDLRLHYFYVIELPRTWLFCSLAIYCVLTLQSDYEHRYYSTTSLGILHVASFRYLDGTVLNTQLPNERHWYWLTSKMRERALYRLYTAEHCMQTEGLEAST